MIDFTSRLKKEIDTNIERIECSEVSIITKPLKASRVLADTFKQLKSFIMPYNFPGEEEEILFFIAVR
jgi:hypothetical protein